MVGVGLWKVCVASDGSIARTERFNVDVGFATYLLGVSYLDNGYYDPKLYQHHAAVIHPYWKISNNVGLGADGRRGYSGMIAW